MSTELLARFSSFAAGHYGLIDPAVAAKGAWGGQDIVEYLTGYVGPRPGFEPLTSPGAGLTILGIEYLENARELDPDWSDGLWMATADASSPRNITLRYTLGATPTASPVTAGSTGAMGTFPLASDLNAYPPATFCQDSSNNDGNWITYCNVLGTLWRFDVRTDPTNPSQVTLPVALGNIVKYRDWLVGVDLAVVANRVYFSELTVTGPEFTSWPAGNHFDVGDSYPITALIPTANGLLVGKATGWWIVTGALGTSRASSRPLAKGYGPAGYQSAKLRPDGSVALLTADGTPAVFRGVTTDLYPDQRFLAFDPVRSGVIVTASSRKTLYIGVGDDPHPLDDGDATWDRSTRIHMRDEQTGAWSQHSLPGNVLATVAAPAIELGASRIPDVGRYVALAHSDNQLARWRFETAKPGPSDLDQRATATPSNVSDAHDLAGSVVEGLLHLPAVVDPNGRQTTVRKVRLHIRRWPTRRATGPLANNRVACRVVTFDRTAGPGPVTSEWKTWQAAEPANGFADEEIDFDVRTNAKGAGFQVQLRLTGVAIRDVVVFGEKDQTR